MFFEDVNTLYEKYKYCSFWYELSYDDIVDNVGNWVDFFNITKPSNVYIIDKTHKYSGFVHFIDDSSKPSKYPEGEEITAQYVGENQLSPNQSIFIYVFCDAGTPLLSTIKWIPISPMHVLRCGSESETVKVYLKEIIEMPTTLQVGTGKYIDDEGNEDVDLREVSVLSDSDGHYVELSSRRDGDEFTIITGGGTSFKGKLMNYKTLPTITFNTLYRGNTQTVEVYFDGELVDSKYYDLSYQNQMLTDNKITIGEDITEVELEIYLKHPEYISTRLKYNIPVDYYNCESQEDVEAGLELGLTTIQVPQDLTLSNIALNGIKIRSAGGEINLYGCELSNILFYNLTIVMSDSKSRFINCIFNYCNLEGWEMQKKWYMVNSTITNSRIWRSFLVCSENCIIDNNTIEGSLIFSDDMITITNNAVIISSNSIDYYPNTLYLTGDFDCKGNLFIQNDQYPHFSFDVALIKTIPETDIDEFIRLNDFDIYIGVEGENYDGLFYSYIDESKLHYKEIF